MKNLRFFSLVITLLISFAVTSCKYVNVTEPPVNQPHNNEMLKISASGLPNMDGVMVIGDTIYVENKMVVAFTASFCGKNINNLVWSFADDGSTSTSKYPVHQYNLWAPAVTSVSVTGTDSLNVTHNGSATIKIVNSLDNLAAVVFTSITAAGNNLYSVVIAIHKDVVKNVPGSGYSYKGDITQWQTFTNVASNDENWLIVNHALVAPTNGEVGKYFVVRATLPLSTYKIGTSRPNNGVLWGTFWGEYSLPNSLMGFQLVSNGTGGAKAIPIGVTPAAILPGDIQDLITCFTPATKLTIFVNNKAPFSNIEFIRLQDSNGVFLAPIRESPVPGFPNWGMIEVPWALIPTSNNSIVYVFGPDFRSPNIYSPNMAESEFFDANYHVLKAVIISVQGNMAIQPPTPIISGLER